MQINQHEEDVIGAEIRAVNQPVYNDVFKRELILGLAGLRRDLLGIRKELQALHDSRLGG